ncbi:MAG: hypothetical protein M5U12_32990 [Verrucomicrobia bacterium]|nr:hypothetical protein [Verrucomicrobiota bacterium]
MNPGSSSQATSDRTSAFGHDPSARRAKRLLWGLVLGIAVLNLLLFLSTRSPRPTPAPEATATNEPVSPEATPPP